MWMTSRQRSRATTRPSTPGIRDGYIRYEAAGHTTFPPEGGLLGTNDSLEVQRRNQQAVFDSGVHYNFELRHTEVKLLGSLTALTTGYVTGVRSLPDGTSHRISWRRSAVWIKQDGIWKQVHRHFSPLRIPQ